MSQCIISILSLLSLQEQQGSKLWEGIKRDNILYILLVTFCHINTLCSLLSMLQSCESFSILTTTSRNEHYGLDKKVNHVNQKTKYYISSLYGLPLSPPLSVHLPILVSMYWWTVVDDLLSHCHPPLGLAAPPVNMLKCHWARDGIPSCTGATVCEWVNCKALCCSLHSAKAQKTQNKCSSSTKCQKIVICRQFPTRQGDSFKFLNIKHLFCPTKGGTLKDVQSETRSKFQHPGISECFAFSLDRFLEQIINYQNCRVIFDQLIN